MAGTAEVPLSLDDVQRVSDRVPFIADLAPSGKYFMEDLYNIGGTPSVLKLLVAAGLMDGNIPTVTGKTLKENGLKEVEKIMEVQSKLIVNRSAYKTKTEKIESIISTFRNCVQ